MGQELGWAPATEAYLWGYPLLSVHRTQQLLCSRNPPGELHHLPELATPKDRAVVVPNNDTLYSSGWFDLRYGDLTIEVPPMDHPGRYWNVMVVDAYTGVHYLRRKTWGTDGLRARVSFDPHAGDRGDDPGLLRLPTATAWVIARVLVESPDDLPTAQALQQAFRVDAPKAHSRALTARGGRPAALGEAGVGFFHELKQALLRDPSPKGYPSLSPAASALLESLEGQDEARLLAGLAEGEQLLKAGRGGDDRVVRGWRSGRAAGGPGQDVLRRALGAKYGLGGHYALENRSYTALGDAQGQPLDGRRPLRLRFPKGGLPPCSGFWSLTAYGPDLYLVENALKRYALGDRTPGLRYDADGGLSLELSAAPPRQRENWLPVPPGPYLLGLRVYEGDPSVVDCAWFPPSLEPQESEAP